MIHLDFTFEEQRLIATRGDVDWQLTIVDTFTGAQACLSMPDEHAAMLLNFMMLHSSLKVDTLMLMKQSQ